MIFDNNYILSKKKPVTGFIRFCLYFSILTFYFIQNGLALVPPRSALSLNKMNNFLPTGGSDSLYFFLKSTDSYLYDLTILSFNWTSSNENVVTIDKRGKVTALQPGNAIVYLRSQLYDSLALPCSLTVYKQTLPIVYFEVAGKILNEPKIPGWMRVYDELGGLNYEGHIGIEIRGSSTRGFPKNSYAVETRRSEIPDDNRNVALLGLPRENDWIFYAPYTDKSLMRNVFAFTLSGKMGWYASRHKYCEVYMNGNYQGIYVLLEKIKQDVNRVNIQENIDTENFKDMSFIVKRDKFDGTDNEYFPSRGVPIQYHYPKPFLITERQRDFIKSFWAQFEDAIWGSNFKDENNGYRKYIDVDSWIDYMLIKCFSQDVDGFGYSNFFFRDVGGKITRGPVWDFNIAFGNANYWIGMNTDGFYPGHWYDQLLKDEFFCNKLIERWFDLRNTHFSAQNIFSFLDSTAAAIKEARIRNFECWHILGIYVWPNVVTPPTYEGELKYMYDFIRSRLEWIDDNIEAVYKPTEKENPGEEQPTIETYNLKQNYPNPFNPYTIINYQIPEEENVVLEIYNLLGQKIRTLVNHRQQAGLYTVTWDGQNEYGIIMPTGFYFYRIRAGTFIETKKMVLAR